MSIDNIENTVMLVAVIVALLTCLFRYIEIPEKGYLFLCIAFLSSLLSDYYWTVYTFVMGDDPNVSEYIAYFGWDLCYLFLLIAVLKTRSQMSGKYFNVLMLLPVPINVLQFFIYIQYGGFFTNLWQTGLLTVVAVICMQSLLCYIKYRKDGETFPYLHALILVYLATLFGQWTSSCYAWDSNATNPYYYCVFAGYALLILLPRFATKDYSAKGLKPNEKGVDDIGFQVRVQVLVSFIIFGGCIAGYYLAQWMKRTLPEDVNGSETYSIIAIMLFVLSIFMDILILALLYVVALRYRHTRQDKQITFSNRRNKFNLIFTIAITFGLMIFAVIYNSRLFYSVAVTGIYDAGVDRAESAAAEIENYLTNAQSTLRVSADSIDLMIMDGESREKIYRYLIRQTQNHAQNFDENFTGLYAYVNGEYLDGLEWIPPEDYDATTRDWYRESIEAGGKTLIVSPYVDAQTNEVVITICKMLTRSSDPENGKYNVVALDVIVNHIQEVIEGVDVSGRGYAMIVNSDGLIVAHHDSSLNGKNIGELYGHEAMDTIVNAGNDRVNTTIDGRDCTMFESTVMDQWRIVVVVDDYELLQDVRSQLVVNVVVMLIIFILISVFYYLGYKNEQAYNVKMEELNAGRRKQEYEAEVLRLEKRSADEANKAKSDFLADMSHEIRTPINAILGMNEMILRETSDSNVIDYSRNIKSSGRNLLHLVNSILDFSKIEDGKMEIIPVRYSLSTLITYLVNSVQERAEAKGLKLNISVDPKLPSELNGDDTRIDQIILNLLTNAVKYTHEGSVTLKVEEKDRTNDKVLMYVEVSDTGIGIKEDDMEKLFQSFERLDKVRNRNIEGTGLGISITTKLLNLMDSELKVSSKYGEGSVFSFELWQKIENTTPVGVYKVGEIDGSDSEDYHESFRAPDAKILIVDDTKMNIIVAVNLLKSTQMQIDTAQGGREAIKLCEDNAYDAILLDQRMPGMDGTETLKEIRALPDGKNADTPIICLTADAIRGAKERYIAEGFSDYLTKPVDGRTLERMLRTYLPPEKVQKASAAEEAKAGEDMPDDPVVKELAAKGFDTASALKYCQQDVAIYHTILEEFATEYSKKSVSLDGYFNSKSWNDYSILIHSVKSSSKTIGATKLSERAATLEKASKDGDIALVTTMHDETMKMYGNVADIIRGNLGITEVAVDEDDDGILEFAPSGE